MRADSIPDDLWRRLSERLSGRTCPGCLRSLTRPCVDLQPFDRRVRVKCLRCGYLYVDAGNGVVVTPDMPS